MIYFQTKRRSLFCSGFLEKLAGSTLWKWSKVNKKCKMLTKKRKENCLNQKKEKKTHRKFILHSLGECWHQGWSGRLATKIMKVVEVTFYEDDDGWEEMIMPMLKISHSLAPFEDLAEFGNFPSGSPLPRKILSSPAGLPSWSMSFSTRIPCAYICTPIYLLVVFWIYLWVVLGFGF